MCRKAQQIVNTETALWIYLNYPEMSTTQIKQLFGVSDSCARRYKSRVKDSPEYEGVKTLSASTINTRVAYQIWGIDVAVLERNWKKLAALKEKGLKGVTA